MATRVEPRLEQALNLPGAPDELLDVVVRFDVGLVTEPDASLPLVEQRKHRAAMISDAVANVLDRAGQAAGVQPAQVTPFPLLGSAYVQAPRSYVRALLQQQEVAGATLNSSLPPSAD